MVGVRYVSLLLAGVCAFACAAQSRRLEDGEKSYHAQAWVEARTTLSGFVQDHCDAEVTNAPACTRAHLLLADVESQLGAFDAALEFLQRVQETGEPEIERERARTLAEGMRAKLAKQIGSQRAMLFVEHEIRQDTRFIIDSDRYLLDGEDLLTFADAVALRSPRARVLAKPITPGHHTLGVHVKYIGAATHAEYSFESYNSTEFDLPAGSAARIVVKTEFLRQHANPLQAIRIWFEGNLLSATD